MKKNEHVFDAIQTVGNIHIVRLYANAEYHEWDALKEHPYYGDIYESEEEVLRDHPKAKVITGYGLAEVESGYSPDEADDWYDSVEEAKEAALSFQE